MNEYVEWFVSSYSDGGQRVEVGRAEGGALIRDSKNPKSVKLGFAPDEWSALLAASAAR